MSDEFQNSTGEQNDIPVDDMQNSVDEVTTQEENAEAVSQDVVTDEPIVQENNSGTVSQSEIVDEPDGRYGYTKDSMPYRENDFRSSATYQGYTNNNGYTNNEYVNGTYSSTVEDAQQAEGQADSSQNVYDKHAKKAAMKQEKKRAKAAKKNQDNDKKGSFFGRVVRLIIAAIVFGVIAGATMIGMGYGYNYFNNNADKVVARTAVSNANTENVRKEETTTKGANDSDEEDAKETSSNEVTITDVSDVADKVMPCVVSITSTEMVQAAQNDDFWSYFYGNGNDNSKQYKSTGAGSGIIIGENDTELLIVTNQHVVADADTLSVQFVNEKSIDANLKSQNEKQDLAIVSVALKDIDKDTIDAIKIATIGDSDSMKVGEGSIAIGNALGYGQSVTTGVISALDRTITVDTNKEITVIQTDAAINPGNSGGALLNMKGEVIGINCVKSASNYTEGMGYAIPISHVKDLIDNMMTQETKSKVDEKEKGYLNIYGKDVTADLSKMYDIPEGVYIMEVIKDGAAEKAGLSKYDVITALDGNKISSMAELQEELAYYKKGEKVKLTIQTLEKKEYVEKEVEVKLGGEME